MTVTTTGLTKAAGLCRRRRRRHLHRRPDQPPAACDASVTDTNEWVLRCAAKVVMCALALAGITGMYLRQVRQMRRPRTGRLPASSPSATC